MNRESSRSHTVLTLTIQSMTLVDGINHIRESRFNLVDLAGSERQKQANTEGIRLKEAGNINKSLLCLGSVINALGEIASGHSRHVVSCDFGSCMTAPQESGLMTDPFLF